MKQILLCLSILLTPCLNLNAQSIGVSVNVSRNGYATVTQSNELHTIQGANATYTISLVGLGNVEQVVTCEYTYNGTTAALPYSLDGGKLTIDPVQQLNLSVTDTEINKFSVSLVVKESDKEENTSLSADAQNVWVHAEPTCELTKEPSRFIYQEKMPSQEWEMNANGGGTWTYKWYSTSGQEGTASSFSTPEINTDGTTTVTIEAKNIAPDGNTVWRSYNKSWTFTRYEKAGVSLAVPENTVTTAVEFFQNMKWSLSATQKGGYPTGWSFEWKDADTGEALGQSSSYNLGATESEAVVNRHVTLTVTNTATISEGATEEWFRKSYNYYADFYSLPVVEFAEKYPINVIDGDQVLMEVTIKDKKNIDISSDSHYTWTYTWNNKSTEKGYTYTAENKSNNDGFSNPITLKVEGKLNKGDGQIYSAPLCQHTFIAWPKPNVKDLSESGITKVECGGRPLNLKISATGGQKSGWTYQWYKDDVKIDGATTDTYEKILERGSLDPMITENYRIKVVNVCEGTIRKEETYNYTVQLYPEPWTPQDISIKDTNRGKNSTTGIREGNMVDFSCDECYGGYPSVWTYRWTKDGSIISTTRSTAIAVDTYAAGDIKDYSRSISIQCNVNNSFNGTPWSDKTYSKSLVIYRKPQTPLSISKKGNGTSGTVVATINVTDADLNTHDYYLVFGYRNNIGIMHDELSLRQQNPGSVRWSAQIPASVINNPDNTLYVYALWKYPNGVEITSGLRTIDDVKEDWDDSTYSGSTRSVISNSATGINDILSGTSESDIRESYSINGMKSDRLNKGLNIVKMSDGKVKKVIVK